jgi:hypothetical protein
MFHSSKLVAALGMLLLLAAAASAQNQPTTYIYDAYVDNQGTVNTCSAGENVNLNGTIRFSYQVTSDASGNHFVIKAARWDRRRQSLEVFHARRHRQRLRHHRLLQRYDRGIEIGPELAGLVAQPNAGADLAHHSRYQRRHHG